MAMNKPFYPKKKKSVEKNDAFTIVKVYVPKMTAILLSEASEETQLPMSRLVAYAIDNELDAPKPFTYLAEAPKAPYVESAYVDEAGRMYRYIKKFFEFGITIDSLLLCRRDYNVQDRHDVMLAHRELLKVGLIEEFEKINRITGKKQIRYKVADDITTTKSRAARPVHLGVDDV